MRYAVIKDGLVENVIEAPEDFSLAGFTLVASETAGIGWSYAGGVFVPPSPPPIPVPAVIPLWKAKAALASAGLLAGAEQVIAAASPEVQWFWEYASEMRRDAPTLAALAGALSLSSAQVDDLFRSADAIAL